MTRQTRQQQQNWQREQGVDTVSYQLYHELEDHGIAPVHFKCSSKVFTTAKASGESEEAIGNAQ